MSSTSTPPFTSANASGKGTGNQPGTIYSPSGKATNPAYTAQIQQQRTEAAAQAQQQMQQNQLGSLPETGGPAPATQQQQQGLPPTGLQQQLNSLNSFYSSVGGATMGEGGPGIGYNVHEQQFQQSQQSGSQQLGARGGMGSSLDEIARNMAQRFGMAIGRGRLVDESGNFLYTPKQLADASGGALTMGEAAANMNYISQALTKKQNEQQQALGIAAIQTGLGQVQSRGRGSLAVMMSGQYEALADLYSNQQYESADFSYYIQREQMDIAQELQRRQEEMVRKQAQGAFWTGVGTTIVGLYTGNLGLVAGGAAQVGGSVGQTGYF